MKTIQQHPNIDCEPIRCTFLFQINNFFLETGNGEAKIANKVTLLKITPFHIMVGRWNPLRLWSLTLFNEGNQIWPPLLNELEQKITFPIILKTIMCLNIYFTHLNFWKISWTPPWPLYWSTATNSLQDGLDLTACQITNFANIFEL